MDAIESIAFKRKIVKMKILNQFTTALLIIPNQTIEAEQAENPIKE